MTRKKQKSGCSGCLPFGRRLRKPPKARRNPMHNPYEAHGQYVMPKRRKR